MHRAQWTKFSPIAVFIKETSTANVFGLVFRQCASWLPQLRRKMSSHVAYRVSVSTFSYRCRSISYSMRALSKRFCADWNIPHSALAVNLFWLLNVYLSKSYSIFQYLPNYFTSAIFIIMINNNTNSSNQYVPLEALTNSKTIICWSSQMHKPTHSSTSHMPIVWHQSGNVAENFCFPFGLMRWADAANGHLICLTFGTLSFCIYIYIISLNASAINLFHTPVEKHQKNFRASTKLDIFATDTE